MAHFPKPFYKKARGLWYVQIDRKQINLGPDRDEAFRQYHQMMSQPRAEHVSPESVVAIIDSFLDWVHKNRAPDTFEWYRHRLQRFVTQYPEITVSQLRPFHVEQWVGQYDLAVTTKHNYFRSIKTCLKWAVKQGYIQSSPLKDMEVPSPERREVFIPPDEFNAMLVHVPDGPVRDLLVTTYHTGCRPQESLRLMDRYVELGQARWVFPQNKSKGKRAPRVVYLDDQALAITKRLLAESNGGELFRNTRGNPWTKDSINCAVDRVRIRMGKAALKSAGKEPTDDEIAKRIKRLKKTRRTKGVERVKTAAELRCEAKQKLFRKMAYAAAPRYSLYSLRHSWATNALKSGVDALTVALLMGHRDPAMLARVYQHLSHSPDHMLEQAIRATDN
ncbi:tyrosine-type recombinase/integrase [Planctomycetes bacterium K23_9]|uniref:Site-specific tyrosine recombinase XerC n=1 Tax=Stieleria marina TaxID=1930275 RepID=A0A517P282_9BACT|nr:site-specific tyrosine recombinase XerC [Planctomycetes bacterium K23_9]